MGVWLLNWKMAWGYWSASSVLPDRGRSPRRAGTSAVHVHPNPPTAREVMETHDESIIHTASTSRDSRDHSASPHSSSNGGHSHHHEVRHAVPASALFGESYGELSRRPSLDLGSVRSALASCSGGGTLSAGSTLTRGGTLADCLPPPCPHHHRVYVDHHKHYEQPIQPHAHHSHSRASSTHHTDDEDDLEPTYATGKYSKYDKNKIQSPLVQPYGVVWKNDQGYFMTRHQQTENSISLKMPNWLHNLIPIPQLTENSQVV